MLLISKAFRLDFILAKDSGQNGEEPAEDPHHGGCFSRWSEDPRMCSDGLFGIDL
jgi:hypothetical protein